MESGAQCIYPADRSFSACFGYRRNEDRADVSMEKRKNFLLSWYSWKQFFLFRMLFLLSLSFGCYFSVEKAGPKEYFFQSRGVLKYLL